MICYFNGKFLELSEIKVSPLDRGFLFADGVYEALRTYRGKLFRYNDHLERLKKSLAGIRLEFNRVDEIEKIIYDLIDKNGFKNEVLVYLQITRGASFPRIHSFPKEKVEATIFIMVQELIEKPEEQQAGIKVITQEDIRWLRCDIKSVSLLPTILANQKSADMNANEAIFVRNGLITEGTHTNFFGVKQRDVFTAPISHLLLDGVTRKAVLEVCRKTGVVVHEEYIKASEMKSYNEFFVTSTTKEITPVVMINGWSVGNGDAGALTLQLLKEFKKNI